MSVSCASIDTCHELFRHCGRYLFRLDALERRKAFFEGASKRPHLVTARGQLRGPDRDAHEFVGPAEIFIGIVGFHEVDDRSAALLDQQR